jgi:anti-sigma-K factor RskA
MHERQEELLALYALGALAGADRVEIETHLASGCQQCQKELIDFEDLVASMAYAAAPAAPPQSLRKRALAVTNPAQPPSSVPAGAVGRVFGVGVIAAGIIGVSGFAIVYLAWALMNATSDLARRVEELNYANRTIIEQADQIESKERILQLIRAPESRLTRLSTESAPSPGIDVFWNTASRSGVLVARNLPPAGTGKTYELWLIAGKEAPAPAAIFDVDARGTAMIEIPEMATAGTPSVFAITREVAGGADVPTLPILMAGNFPTE